MLNQTVRNITLAFVVTLVTAGLFVQSAAACDRDKLNRLAQGTSLAALAQSNARPGIAIAGTSASAEGTGITGLWDVRDYAQGYLIDEYFDTWHSDGNELFVDATNPAQDNVCQGIWKQVSPTSFKLKHVSW